MQHFSYMILFALTIILNFFSFFCHKCIHDQLKIKPKINEAMERKDLRFLQSTAWTPIKIYIDYTYLNSQTSFDASTVSFVKSVIDNTIKVYTNLLNVQSVNPTLKVTQACSDIPLSGISNDLQNGVTADIAIFPFFDKKAGSSTEAYAASCLQDPTTNRPNAGIMALNPEFFKKDRPNALAYYTLLVLHEFNHIFSFSSDLFELFVDSSYKTLPLSSVVKNTTVNGVPKQMIVSPKVVSTAQKHFACPSLQGVEIEDQGGEGTAGSHWESRVMLGDFMIGETFSENVISEITLALFEDSGWYKTNYFTGGLFRYGKNKGCDFVQKKCINGGQSSFPNDFCLNSGAAMCLSSKLAKGICDFGARKDIPSAYQYFTDETIGGYTNADFCPVANYFGDDDKNYFFSSSCAYGLKDYENLGETIGTNSGCFMSSLIPKSLPNFASLQGQNRAICYSYSCNSDGTYVVTILDKTITCNKEGGAKTVDGLDGTFYCPDYLSVCTNTSACKDAVECALNKVSYNFPTIDYTINSSSYATLNGTSPTNSTSPTASTIKSTLNPSGSNHSVFLESFMYMYLLVAILILGN